MSRDGATACSQTDPSGAKSAATGQVPAEEASRLGSIVADDPITSLLIELARQPTGAICSDADDREEVIVWNDVEPLYL